MGIPEHVLQYYVSPSPLHLSTSLTFLGRYGKIIAQLVWLQS